jgi:hypothetical protein
LKLSLPSWIVLGVALLSKQHMLLNPKEHTR